MPKPLKWSIRTWPKNTKENRLIADSPYPEVEIDWTERNGGSPLSSMIHHDKQEDNNGAHLGNGTLAGGSFLIAAPAITGGGFFVK